MSTQSEKKQEPKKKRQHFVPKSYLKFFSYDGGTRIHLIHLETLRPIVAVGLKEQCYDDYFYGKDGKMENAFAPLEGESARVIDAIISSGKLPAPASPDDIILRTNICLQWGRTRTQAENAEELFNRTVKALFRNDWRAEGITDHQIDEVTFGSEKPAAASVGAAADMVPFMNDLAAKLVDAGQHGEFVTSDAPVVFLNPYYFGKYSGGLTGLNAAGLVIVFPVSPRYLIVLYDKSYYRVGSPSKNTVVLESAGDVAELNKLQALYAESNVYFRDSGRSTEYVRLLSEVVRLRRTQENVAREASLPGTQPGLLVHAFRTAVNYNPRLSFLTLLNKWRGKTGAVDKIPRRNSAMAALFDDYQRERAAGRAQRGFLEYILGLDPDPID